MKYPMIQHKGHFILRLGVYSFLLDTGTRGMNITFNFAVRSIDIGGHKFALKPIPQEAMGLSRAQMIDTFGTTIDGVLDPMTFSMFDNVEFNKTMGSFLINDEESERTNMVPLTDNCSYKIKVNGKDVEGFLDTGAHTMMVYEHSLLKGTSKPVLEPTFMGVFPTEEYSGTAEFAGVKKETPMLKWVMGMPRDTVKHDVYFNLNDFSDSYFGFDFFRGVVYFN